MLRKGKKKKNKKKGEEIVIPEDRKVRRR